MEAPPCQALKAALTAVLADDESEQLFAEAGVLRPCVFTWMQMRNLLKSADRATSKKRPIGWAAPGMSTRKAVHWWLFALIGDPAAAPGFECPMSTGGQKYDNTLIKALEDECSEFDTAREHLRGLKRGASDEVRAALDRRMGVRSLYHHLDPRQLSAVLFYPLASPLQT